MWADDDAPQLQTSTKLNQREFFDAHREKTLDGIIEQVRDGSTCRMLVLLADVRQLIVVQMSGIAAPTLRQNVPNMPDIIEPHAQEAKHFVESRLLHRNVTVVLHSVAGQNFYGDIGFPAGNITEALVSAGLAKVVEWSTSPGAAEKLLILQDQAAKSKLRIWKSDNSVAKKMPSTAFSAKVVRIFGADTIIVEHLGRERKLTLSSMKGPKREINDQGLQIGYNHLAVEFLRSRIIGEMVDCKIDYVKEAQDQYERRECATVMKKDKNISELLLKAGLATLVRHKKDDNARSPHYSVLQDVEEKAKTCEVGVHSKKELPVLRVADASESAVKARSYLGFLQRSPAVPVVVEHVVSGSRFKVYVPGQSCRLTFMLAAINTPRTARSASERGQPFAKEAAMFTSRLVMQRNVNISVLSLDKSGGFIGSMTFYSKEGNLNLAVELVRNGFASVHNATAQSTSFGQELIDAQETAKAQNSNIWSIKSEPQIENLQVDTKPRPCVISEIDSTGLVYLQFLEESEKLIGLMKKFDAFHAVAGQVSAAFVAKTGDYCSALYSADKRW